MLAKSRRSRGNKIHTLRESEFVVLSTLLQCLVEELVETIGSNTLVVGLNVFLECRTAERGGKDAVSHIITTRSRQNVANIFQATHLDPLRSLSYIRSTS